MVHKNVLRYVLSKLKYYSQKRILKMKVEDDFGVGEERGNGEMNKVDG